MPRKGGETVPVRPGEPFIQDGMEYVKLDEAAGNVFVLGVEATLKNNPFDGESEKLG